MSVRQAISEKRDVTISFTGVPMPIDAYKAALERVQINEGQYHLNPALVTDLTAASTLMTGTQNRQIYVFNLTTVNASGTYTFEYVETRPNADNEF